MMIPCEPEEEEVVTEERWTNEDGSNVFDLTFENNNMVRSTMKSLFPDSDRALIFDSYSTQQMTPLDMLYETNASNPSATLVDEAEKEQGDKIFKFDEFYDGTGSLVWLACVALCYLVAHDLVSPLAHHDDSKSTDNKEVLQICELGCGTGLASIATLMTSALRKEAGVQRRRVLMTDNDPEALELAAQNCELNELDPESYDHQLLSWGIFPEREEKLENASDANINYKKYLESSMDVVLAADVIYDISMIPPLLQTAAWLLNPGGSLVVSHVPRFCLPKDEQEQQAETEKHGEKSSPQQELENHIIEQATLVGLRLRETIRPHQALENIIDNEESGSIDECQISCAQLEHAHAVLFVFSYERNNVG